MKIIKKNIKLIIGIILGLIISGISVYAVTVSSSDVTYNNTNVQSAINDLYNKVANGSLNGIVIPFFVNYESYSQYPTFGTAKTIWTNNTGVDKKLYFQSICFLSGNASNPEGYFRLTDGTILYTFNFDSSNAYGYSIISFTVPAGKTLEVQFKQNYGRIGTLSEYPLTANTPISSN